MNNVSLIGRLGQHPELRATTGGKKVATFSIAVENRHRSDGEPDWVQIEVWGKTAEVIAEHKAKGDQVAVTGRLTSSQWETGDGDKRSRLFVTAESVDFLHNANTGKEAA